MADAIYAAPPRAINPVPKTKLTPGWCRTDVRPTASMPPVVGRGFMTAGLPDALMPSLPLVR